MTGSEKIAKAKELYKQVNGDKEAFTKAALESGLLTMVGVESYYNNCKTLEAQGKLIIQQEASQ